MNAPHPSPPIAEPAKASVTEKEAASAQPDHHSDHEAPVSNESFHWPAHLPYISVQARGMALAVLATVAIIGALHWAQKFFIPLVFGIFIAYTLNPLVVALERIKIPRMIGSTVVMVVLLTGIATAANSLTAQFNAILDQAPAAAMKLSDALKKLHDGKRSTLEQMQAAATEIEKATNPAAPPGAKKPAAPPVVVAHPSFQVSSWLLASSMSAASFIGETAVVILLVYFLLLSGDTFKRKLVKLTGPSFSQKKITVQILEGINTSIQSYMFMLLVTNVLLALMMWGALWWVGLENAGAWAVASGFIHLIPYFGPILIATATGMAALIQFGTISMMLVLAGISLIVATIVGTFVTTWMTGRIAKMNAAAVFIGLLFWGWLWGVAGLLLGIPIVVIIKVIAEHVEGMQTVAELLGE